MDVRLLFAFLSLAKELVSYLRETEKKNPECDKAERRERAKVLKDALRSRSSSQIEEALRRYA